MRDPCSQRLLVAGVARVGHFLHDEHFHLLLKIERAPDLQRLDFVRADPSPEISEIGPADRERRAGHDAGAVFAEQHPPQDRRDVDRRGVEREKLRRFAGSLDPVNVFLRALFQKSGDPDARIANPPAELL